MVRILAPLAVCCVSAIALAQTSTETTPAPYTPAVPPPSVSSYGGWGYGGYGGGTVGGSIANGMANVISAQGNYNLATSAAAVNLTQAQANSIRNQQSATNAYFEMRAVNREARAQERGPRPTMEQLARISAMGVPKPLTDAQVDHVTGQVAWPELLQDMRFATEQQQIENLMAKQASQGQLGFSDTMQAKQVIGSMFSGLKSEIKEVPPQLYAQSRSFLQSLMYTMTQTSLD